MKKEKLSLNRLKVESFTTNPKQVKGGIPFSFYCVTEGCPGGSIASCPSIHQHCLVP